METTSLVSVLPIEAKITGLVIISADDYPYNQEGTKNDEDQQEDTLFDVLKEHQTVEEEKMKRNLKLNGKCGYGTALMTASLFFITLSNAFAGGGDSWVRHIKNYSGMAVIVQADAELGNVWFETVCGGSKNGPCTIPVARTEQMKFTTTNGDSLGVLNIKYYDFYGNLKSCSTHYNGAAHLDFGTYSNNCPSHITITGDGDITVNNPSKP
ncbi:MAG: hypothetical protein M0009_14185 [Deltaproteobacteria bacterium]|nr:hypothetical protein [Deltaproteobacteria bacterium]